VWHENYYFQASLALLSLENLRVTSASIFSIVLIFKNTSLVVVPVS
jgi:hypothetical protein